MIKSKELVRLYREQIGRFTYAQMDCITSISNIIIKHGGKAALNGSNWWAREEIVNLRPLTDRSQLYDGCAVLKTVLPGEAGYALPDRYKKHAVKIDYSHIGLGTDEGEILDSTRYGERADGTWERNGPAVSTAPINSRSWDVIGDFEDVDYSDRIGADVPAGDGGESLPDKVSGSAMVTAESGSTVNLRAQKNTKSVVLAYVPVGSMVTVLASDGEWVKVRYRKTSGWMQSRFLLNKGDGVGGGDAPVNGDAEGKGILGLIAEAENYLAVMADILRIMKGIASDGSNER